MSGHPKLCLPTNGSCDYDPICGPNSDEFAAFKTLRGRRRGRGCVARPTASYPRYTALTFLSHTPTGGVLKRSRRPPKAKAPRHKHGQSLQPPPKRISHVGKASPTAQSLRYRGHSPKRAWVVAAHPLQCRGYTPEKSATEHLSASGGGGRGGYTQPQTGTCHRGIDSRNAGLSLMPKMSPKEREKCRPPAHLNQPLSVTDAASVGHQLPPVKRQPPLVTPLLPPMTSGPEFHPREGGLGGGGGRMLPAHYPPPLVPK